MVQDIPYASLSLQGLGDHDNHYKASATAQRLAAWRHGGMTAKLGGTAAKPGDTAAWRHSWRRSGGTALPIRLFGLSRPSLRKLLASSSDDSSDDSSEERPGVDANLLMMLGRRLLPPKNRIISCQRRGNHGKGAAPASHDPEKSKKGSTVQGSLQAHGASEIAAQASCQIQGTWERAAPASRPAVRETDSGAAPASWPAGGETARGAAPASWPARGRRRSAAPASSPAR
eukprot:gene17371-biopygen11939